MEGAMPALDSASADSATPAGVPRPGLKDLAEGILRRNPYLALKNITCDDREGVLVLWGCLPSN
jgi:hypothetical protein